jgi:hypothetical protein
MKASSTLLTLSVLALLAAPVHAIPRKDVLECVLPDGGRATLTSRYDWSPIARIIPADVAERLNQDSWKIVFEATASRSATSPPRSITYSHRGEACLELGLIDGTLFVGTTFLKPDGTWFRNADLPAFLHLPQAEKAQTPAMRQRLAAMDAMPRRSPVLLPRNGRLVYELALTTVKGEALYVVGVFQSFSTDGGVSWSEPRITRQAEIYVLDRSVSAQPFQARAVKLNGKNVVPQ